MASSAARAPLMPHGAKLLACPDYARYDFGPRHPLGAIRYEAALDLLRTAGLLDDDAVLCPPPATMAELELVHAQRYVEAVARLSAWAPLTEAPLEAEARRYGLGLGDTPLFPGAHEAAALISGGGVWAVRALMAQECRAEARTPDAAGTTGAAQTPGAVSISASPPTLHYFHPMGGFHHAMPERAAGFCLYNDAAIAIAVAMAEFGARVLYVDLDVHHADGVQRAFEAEPGVMTISFHESGDYLYPGTGGVEELGTGEARGTAVNVPFAPGTADDSYVAALDAVVPPLAERFRPDLLVSQHGCDTHAADPLADLQLTTRSLEHGSRLLHRLAHERCGGRWLAFGGGGYDLFDVVPRHWAQLWAEMSGHPLPERTPAAWQRRWQRRSARPLSETFRDAPAAGGVPVAAGGAAERNRRTVERVLALHAIGSA